MEPLGNRFDDDVRTRETLGVGELLPVVDDVDAEAHLGSRAKVARIYEALLAEAMPPECLQRVHAPIGLDIGAVTPAEIAISILAELIAVTRGVDTSSLAMKRVNLKA